MYGFGCPVWRRLFFAFVEYCKKQYFAASPTSLLQIFKQNKDLT